MLLVHCGHALHEERLVVALWPNAPLKLAEHRLQVAISSLRTLLRSALTGYRDTLVGRYGNTYLLRLPPGNTWMWPSSPMRCGGGEMPVVRVTTRGRSRTPAIEVCQRVLEIDELDGRVWTLLAEARRLAGGAAPALRTQQVYRDLVAER